MRRFWYVAPIIFFLALIGAILWHYVIVPQRTIVEYHNSEYGFNVVLPQDWRGYTIVTDTWQGMDVNDDGDSSSATVSGPEILIRNPLWTEAQPYQDIPIEIYTPDEWSQILQGELEVSAAPIPPSELGQNTRYVFALPPRYNYAYEQGWQEVQTILQGDPFHAF